MKLNTRAILNLIFILITVSCFVSCSGNSEEDVIQSPMAIPEIKQNIIHNTDSIIIAEKAKELDKIFSRLKKLTGFNGTVLYAEKGRVIFKKAYGFKNVRYRRDSLSTVDVFQLASVSKMFTATAIMILKNDGLVDYDTDIKEYLPDFPYDNVTLRLLMTHRAGLPRYMSLSHSEWENKKIPMDNDDMYELLLEFAPDRYFAPNTGFHYCNTNYAILANIVEKISGKHFEDFVDERIFTPLGMDSSFVYNMRTDTIVPYLVDKGVPGYYYRGYRWREMSNDYLNGVMGDKNVYTSVEDLYKLDRALDDFSLLPDSVVSEAFERGSPEYWKRKNNYGFGWRIKESKDSTAFHFGWWKGFRTFYIRDMKHQKTLVVLTNKDKGPGSSHLWKIIESDTLALGKISRVDVDINKSSAKDNQAIIR